MKFHEILRQRRLALGLTQEQLAQRLGVSRASLYRALDALEARGAVRRAGKRFRIPDPALESC